MICFMSTEIKEKFVKYPLQIKTIDGGSKLQEKLSLQFQCLCIVLYSILLSTNALHNETVRSYNTFKFSNKVPQQQTNDLLMFQQQATAPTTDSTTSLYM